MTIQEDAQLAAIQSGELHYQYTFGVMPQTEREDFLSVRLSKMAADIGVVLTGDPRFERKGASLRITRAVQRIEQVYGVFRVTRDLEDHEELLRLCRSKEGAKEFAEAEARKILGVGEHHEIPQWKGDSDPRLDLNRPIDSLWIHQQDVHP